MTLTGGRSSGSPGLVTALFGLLILLSEYKLRRRKSSKFYCVAEENFRNHYQYYYSVQWVY